MKSFIGLYKLMLTTLAMLPAMLNVLALIFIVLFMFAVLATNLFKNIQSGMALDSDYNNFKNFGNSFLMMFRMSTGEDWHLVMYDCMSVNGLYSFYFIIYVIIVQNIMINLFVLIMLKEFDRVYYSLEKGINLFQFQYL